MDNEAIYAINLMQPYKQSHPTLVEAWTNILLYLLCREERDILRICLDQLYRNIHHMDDIGDLTVMQLGLLLMIST